MPVKTSFVTEQNLRNVGLPQHGKSYTVIPHGDIIDATRKELAAQGFLVKNEQYKTTLDGQVAQGIYHLNYGNDSDMGLMFAWSNSYNKSMRFKCSVGGYVFVCMNGVVRGDMGNFSRKHTGSALHEANQNIIDQIQKASGFYNTLVQDKEMLKNVILAPKEKGTILGRLFAEQEILTLTQVGIVKREMDKPSFNYNCDPNSAWAMYNHVTTALKESHPQTFIEDHEILHDFFINEYGQLTQVQITSKTVDTVVENTTWEVEEEPVSSEMAAGVLFM